MSPREQEILDAVALKGSLEVLELAELLGVSDQTIRRLVKPLAERGLVKKVHGAVVSAQRYSDSPFQERMLVNQAAKRAVAEKVLDLVRDGDSLMLDTGSTTAYIAQALRQRRDLVVVTNSSAIASTLAVVPGNRVFMAGTELRNHDGASFDAAAFATLRRFSARLAILSAAAVNETNGFQVQENCEADLAGCMAEQAEEAVMAVDSSKFGKSALVQLPPFPGKVTLVSEQQPPEHLAKAISQQAPGIVKLQ
ncbi:DeoR/GlpR family DNA-binding transcription regulator [Rhodovibrionaceae bacterium A322]